VSPFLAEFSVAAYRSEDESRLWFEVFDWLMRYEEHDPDWADGYLAVVSGKELAAPGWHSGPAGGELRKQRPFPPPAPWRRGTAILVIAVTRRAVSRCPC
jgi:hypothetical protein